MNGARILLVEDDEGLCDVIARNLQVRGHKVSIAIDVQCALLPLIFGSTSSTLMKTIQQHIAQLKKEHPGAPVGAVPVALVTASGSGLDPDISVTAALYQAPRIASVRGINPDKVHQIIMKHVQEEFPGVFGEAYINVLGLNFALDNAK
ncbi:MAG: hypothetical protein NVS4B7_21090 [Ktedonobacteraceae bacterium]